MDSQLARVVELLPTLDLSNVAAIRARGTRMPVSPNDSRVAVSERMVPGPPGAPQVRVRIYHPPGRRAAGRRTGALVHRLETMSMLEFAEPAPCEAGRAGSRHTWRHYLGETSGPVSPYAAPARAVDLAGLAPAYILTAEYDCLRDEGITHAQRLLQAGVPVELHQFAGAFHAFDLIVRTAGISRRAVDEQVAVLRRALSPGAQRPAGRSVMT